MLKRIVILMLVCVPLCGASAADPKRGREGELEFTRLDLTDGRTLRDVIVKTYDPRSHKLLIVASGKAQTIALDLIPAPLRTKFAEVPQSGGTVSVPAGSSKPTSSPTATNTAERNPAPTRATPAPDGPDTDALRERAQERNRAIVDSHRQLALQHVERYLRYEHQVGPSHAKLSSISVGEVAIRPMQGWVNRYVTTGTAYYEYWDTANYTNGRGKLQFEVHTDVGPDNTLRVVFFDKRS